MAAGAVTLGRWWLGANGREGWGAMRGRQTGARMVLEMTTTVVPEVVVKTRRRMVVMMPGV